MKIFILTLFIICSFKLQAHEADAEVLQVFDRYDELMSGEKIVHEEVFTKGFLAEFEAYDLNHKKLKVKYGLSIKEGIKDKNLLFVKRVFEEDKSREQSTFIFKKENGHWRIQGTISDED